MQALPLFAPTDRAQQEDICRNIAQVWWGWWWWLWWWWWWWGGGIYRYSARTLERLKTEMGDVFLSGLLIFNSRSLLVIKIWNKIRWILLTLLLFVKLEYQWFVVMHCFVNQSRKLQFCYFCFFKLKDRQTSSGGDACSAGPGYPQLRAFKLLTCANTPRISPPFHRLPQCWFCCVLYRTGHLWPELNDWQLWGLSSAPFRESRTHVLNQLWWGFETQMFSWLVLPQK